MTDTRQGNASNSGQAVGALRIEQSNAILFPDPHSVKGRVLGALLRAEHITHKDCWLRFGSSRLSHHIHVLRRHHGWPVAMEWVDVTTFDAGRKAEIGRYSLPDNAIAIAGELGQRYAAETLRIERERRA